MSFLPAISAYAKVTWRWVLATYCAQASMSLPMGYLGVRACGFVEGMTEG